eukprot:jgi/Psemu1/17376/gm1.17376_g
MRKAVNRMEIISGSRKRARRCRVPSNPNEYLPAGAILSELEDYICKNSSANSKERYSNNAFEFNDFLSDMSFELSLDNDLRDRLSKLCANLMEMSGGLVFMHKDSPSGISIEIESRLCSQLTLPTNVAVATTQALKPWAQSKAAKEALSRLLRDANSWLNKMISGDPTSSATKQQFRQSRRFTFPPLFSNHTLSKISKQNFLNLKHSINTEKINVKFDELGLQQERLKCPHEQMGGVYEDPTMKPEDLKALRPEYSDIPNNIFRDRLYRTICAHKEDLYWIDKRNRAMRKIMVTEDKLAKLPESNED